MREFEREFERGFDYHTGFMAAVERGARRPALTSPDPERTWSYGELNGEGNRLARALRAAGPGRGDVLMASLFNTPEFVFCFLGCLKAGVVFSPINFRLAPRELALHIDDARPAVYVYDAGLAPLAREALRHARHRPDVVIVVGAADASGDAIPYSRFVARQSPADVSPESVGPGGEIVRLYTSGTTGRPKGVPLTNANNILRALDVIMHFPLTPSDRTMNLTPWFHAGGFHSGGPCPTLYAGGEVVALREFTPREALRIAERHAVTFLIGAPTSYEVLTRAQERARADLRTLRGAIAMGAPLSRDACARFANALTPNLFNGYGTTETFWNTLLRPFDLPEHAGAAGRACTGDQVRVVRLGPDDGLPDPDDVVPRDGVTDGEIVVRTLKAPQRYHDQPDEDRKHYQRGWFHTNDLGTWDEDGFVTVVGRRDNMIVSAGENIHPAQVEAVINEHPRVADSIVVGAPDVLRGATPVAYVVPADPQLTLEELRGFLTAHGGLADYKRPRLLRLVPELPTTATGKKQHHVAREWAERDFRIRTGAA